MIKILKSFIILVVLAPCISMAQEVGLIPNNNNKSLANIKENIDLVKERNEKVQNLIKENFDDTKNSDAKNDNQDLNSSTNAIDTKALDNSPQTTLDEQTSLVDKIQTGLGSILLGNGKLSSLMFDEKEKEDINKAVDSFKTGQLYSPNAQQKNGEEIDPNRKSYAFLASIMYVDKNYWAVWINNKKITSNDNKQDAELYVESITKEKAAIVWTMSPTKWKILLGLHSDDEVVVNSNNQVVTKFELKPNQSYLLAASSVIEGNPENTMGNKMAFSNSPQQ